MILADRETRVDFLNNEAIAKTVVGLLRKEPERPVTIGVHGDWGAGKSSVLEMIDADLENQPDVLCLKFNGWRFQGFEDAKIALIEGVVSALVEKRPLLAKAGDTVKEAFRHIDWLKLAKKGGGLAFTALTGIPTPEQIQSLVAAARQLLDDPAKLVKKENFDAAITTISDVLKGDVESKSVPKEIEAFRSAFDDLLKEADVDQLVVLIDDLDRCLPDTAIETLEAIRLFVFTAKTAFVVAADEAMIEYAVRKHFPDLPETSGSQTYARNYLEKLIQVPVRIPALGEAETRIYVTLLFVAAELGESHEGFSKLLAAAREKLKRPWKGEVLDAQTISSAIGKDASQALNALTLSEQIGPLLAAGSKGNPRQIKRFLNTLLLRQSMADARGFGSDINLPVLAKLTLAERFLPQLFNQIASSAATNSEGKCMRIAKLEDEMRSENKTPPDKSTQRRPKEEPEDPILADWWASEAIKTWARLPPQLGDVDLRPYLFVAKDRKDYFGINTALGHLLSIVEQLFGPRIAVQGHLDDLKKLTRIEAERVFEEVRSRIIATGAFEDEPDGVEGLKVLVQAHSHLQGRLLDFLESLPTKQVGTWICAGWNSVIQDKARLTALIEKLAAEGNRATKTTAVVALRTLRSSR